MLETTGSVSDPYSFRIRAEWTPSSRNPRHREFSDSLLRRSLALNRGTIDPDASLNREALEEIWGHSGLQELESLAAEPNPQIYFASLVHLGVRLRHDRPVLAQLIFQSVIDTAGDLSPGSAGRAQLELNAMMGTGSSGRRLEFLARNFARDVTDPAMLIGMTVGSTVFSLSRATLLSRLILSGGGQWFTRGLGARAVASVGAFGLEVPSFVLAARGVQTMRGIPQDWYGAALRDEMLGTYLTLGGLKLFGAAGQRLARWSGSATLPRAIAPQLSMFGGILAGHGLESTFGLRPPRSGETMMVDSLLTLLNFNVAGRISGQILGPRWARARRSLDIYSDRLADYSTLPKIQWLEGQIHGWAPAASAAAGIRGDAEARGSLMMMVASNPSDPRMPHQSGRPGGEASDPRSPRVQNNFEMVQALVRRRERLQSRGMPEVTLRRLLSRQVRMDKIPAERLEELHWAVYSRELFDNSPMLRRISKSDLASPERAAERLHSLRPAIAREQGTETYALGTLIQALIYGGRIPFEKLRSYLSMSASLDLYRRLDALQERIASRHFSDPYLLVDRLRPIREKIEREEGRRYQLSTLIEALRWHPDFPRSRQQQYMMVASAREMVGRLPLRRLRLQLKDLRELTRDQVFLRLLKLRMIINLHQGNEVGIGYVLMGLRARGLKNFKDLPVNDSAIQHAFAVDLVRARWEAWGPHIRVLQTIPKKGSGEPNLTNWTRARYGREFLLDESGKQLSDSYVSNMMRWGDFLWEHRQALELPTPKSLNLEAPPSALAERILEFLKPYRREFRGAKHEALFLRLLQLRPKLTQDLGESREAVEISLFRLTELAQKTGDEKLNRTSLVYAAAVDRVLEKWEDWKGPLGSPKLLEAKGEEALRFARPLIRQANGEAYADNTLNALLRWGRFLWRNRRRLKLP